MTISFSSDSERTWQPVVAESQSHSSSALQTAVDQSIFRTPERPVETQYTLDRAAGQDLGRYDQQRLAEERFAMVSIGPIYDALHVERALLVAKDLNGELNNDEARRLSYVRWQLDQYEAAQVGPDIRQLKAKADAQVAMANSVSEFVQALSHRYPSAVRKRR
jgi:hypothetical protein